MLNNFSLGLTLIATDEHNNAYGSEIQFEEFPCNCETFITKIVTLSIKRVFTTMMTLPYAYNLLTTVSIHDIFIYDFMFFRM